MLFNVKIYIMIFMIKKIEEGCEWLAIYSASNCKPALVEISQGEEPNDA